MSVQIQRAADRSKEFRTLSDFAHLGDSSSDLLAPWNRMVAWINSTSRSSVEIPARDVPLSAEPDRLTATDFSIHGQGDGTQIRFTVGAGDAGTFFKIGDPDGALIQSAQVSDLKIVNSNTADPLKPAFLVDNCSTSIIENIRTGNVSALARYGDEKFCIRPRMRGVLGSYRGAQNANVLWIKRTGIGIFQDVSLSANDAPSTDGASVYIQCLPDNSGVPLMDSIVLEDVNIINFEGGHKGLLVDLEEAELNKLFVTRCYFNFCSEFAMEFVSSSDGYNYGVVRLREVHTHRSVDGGALKIDVQSTEDSYEFSMAECQLRSWGDAPLAQISGPRLFGTSMVDCGVARLGGSGFPAALLEVDCPEFRALGGQFGGLQADLTYSGASIFDFGSSMLDAKIGLARKPAAAAWATGAGVWRVLDEERVQTASGTGTVTLKGTGTAGSHSYTSQSIRWKRIEDQVTFLIQLTLSSKDVTMTGNTRIAGLPYSSIGGATMACTWSNLNLGTGKTALNVGTINGSTEMILRSVGESDTLTVVPVSAVSDTTSINVSGSYFTTDPF